MSMAAADSYFVRTGPSSFRPTEHVEGAWSSREMHFSPIGGLIVHALQLHQRDRGLLLSRVSFDILGVLTTGPCRIDVETVRPGRTIELVEATLHLGGRPAIRARAWYLLAADTATIAGGAADPLPAPETLERESLAGTWNGGYIRSLDYRPVVPPRPGRGTAWVQSLFALVADEAADEVATFTALIDTANGIAVREDPEQWLFPNVDLTVHFHRQPSGRWVGLDTTVVFGPTAQGLTSTVLHDQHGPVGRAEQILTIRPACGSAVRTSGPSDGAAP